MQASLVREGIPELGSHNQEGPLLGSTPLMDCYPRGDLQKAPPPPPQDLNGCAEIGKER